METENAEKKGFKGKDWELDFKWVAEPIEIQRGPEIQALRREAKTKGTNYK